MLYKTIRIFFLLLTLQLSFNLSAQTIVTVGWSSDCDYDESITTGQIQAAIDADHDEIRVVNTQAFTEQIDIGAQSVIIKGAYNSCLDAENDVQSTDLTLISGETFTQSAFNINSSDNLTAVTIDGFDISKVSDNGVDNFNGSGVSISNTVGSVNLNNLYVHSNPDAYDGGISISNENITSEFNISMTDVISAYNIANSGAGLNCFSNGLTQINIDGLSGFSFNLTDSHGGGINLSNCNLTFEISAQTPQDSTVIGINNNESLDGQGGGISVFGNSQVTLKGQSNLPLKINNNRAKDGGGIGVNAGGENTTLIELTNSQMFSNQAYSRYGGAVYAIYGAEVIFKGSENCLWNDLCHLIDSNTADDDGGAFYLANGGIITVNKAEITRSRSGSSGAVAGLRNDNSSLSINNSLVHHNGGVDHTEFNDWYTIRNLSGEVNVSINYSTFADNEAQFASISPFISNGTEMVGSFTLVGSIMSDSVSALSYDTPPTNYTPTAVVNCVIFKNISTNPDIYQTYEQVIEDTLTFVDAAQGNYRLGISDTTAIDRCDEVNYPAVLQTDVDGQTRPYDELSIINDFGSLDIGFDEVNLDLIFKQGFE